MLQRQTKFEKDSLLTLSNDEWKMMSKEILDKCLFFTGSTGSNNGTNDDPLYQFHLKGNKKMFVNSLSDAKHIISELEKQIDKTIEYKQLLASEVCDGVTPDLNNHNDLLALTERGLRIFQFDRMIKYLIGQFSFFKKLTARYLCE